MKAAQLIKYGGDDSLKTNADVAKPTIQNDQVLVEVHAAGVNPFDVMVREGMARQMADPELPATIGGDVSGVVVEVGSDATSFSIGQEVFGQAGALSGHGSFAEITPVSAGQLAAKPKAVDFETAAALPLVASSAYQALIETIQLMPDQKILIHGGAGGIGAVAVQLAKHVGAHVITTVGSKDVEYVKSLGADEVIDYESQDFTKLVSECDAVFDTVGGETNRKSYQVLRSGGTLVSMAAQPDEELVSKTGINYHYQFTQVTSERLSKIAQLVDEGNIKINIDKIFSLDDAAQALEYQKTGHPRGKVVIKVR